MSANLMSLARSGGKFLKLYGDRKMMKPLPYDAEVEWLVFNDANVDLPVEFSNESSESILIDVRVSMFKGELRSGVIFAIAPGTHYAQGALRLRTNSKSFTIDPFTSGSGYTATLNVAEMPEDYPVELRYLKDDTTKQSCVINDVIVESAPVASGGHVTYEGYTPILGSVKYKNSSGNIAYNGLCFGRIRSFYLKNLRTGKAVDLIPVRKGQDGYFYDRISGKMLDGRDPYQDDGSIPTGTTFFLGPDKTT